MRDPILFRRDDVLSPETAVYWKDLLYRVTKIGTELEVAPARGRPRPEFEEAVRAALAPSGTVDALGANGVLDVQTEHCGIELRVIGRHPHFHTLHTQYKRIMAVLLAEGSRARPTCGLHFHILTPTLAEPVPEIILANLWNLVRRYAPELRFITSTGKQREGLCRRRNHNSHLEMVRLSPGTMHMADIQAKLKASRRVPEHQNFLNLEHIQFTLEGDVFPFHIEFRFPDADLSATAVTTKTFLFLALLLKAVDLSQYGVIHVGKIEPWRRKSTLLDWLSNNDGKLATSDTSRIDDDVIEELRQGCYELLDFLAPTLDRLSDGLALDVLWDLAENPISLRRCAGYDWVDIEGRLAGRLRTNELGLDETDRRLMQRIELGEWSQMGSNDSWQWHAARELFLTPQELERRLVLLDRFRGLRWDERRGTMVFTT